MSTRQHLHLMLTSQEDLARFPVYLKGRSGETVVVEIPPDATDIAYTAIFRRLAGIGRSYHVKFSIKTEDPTCLELAEIYNMEIEPEPEPEPVAVAETATNRHEQPTRHAAISRDRATADDEPMDLWDPNASYSWVISPPADYQPRSGGRARHRRRRSTGALFMAWGSVLVALLIVMVALAVVVPTATVAVTPETRQVTESLVYGVRGASVVLEAGIVPFDVTTDLQFETSIPTTGERFVPDGSAAGQVTLSNASTVEQSVPAGTELMSTVDGISFVTDQDVVIPAADPFGSQSFGSAAVSVTAVTPGSPSNIGPGQLAGQLDANIFYTNREAMTGGTELRIATVSEADIQQLRDVATQSLNAQAAAALDAELPVDGRLIDSTTTIAEPQMSFSSQAGADATEISVSATSTVSAMAYNASELTELAESSAAAQLESATPQGFDLDGEAITIGEPRLLTKAGEAPAFEVALSAPAVAEVTEDQRDALRDAATGADAGTARDTIAGFPWVREVQVTHGPSWLPFDLAPRLGARVDVNIVSQTP